MCALSGKHWWVFFPPSPWVSNEVEANRTVLGAYLSALMMSAETGTLLQRVFAWELVQNDTVKAHSV